MRHCKLMWLCTEQKLCIYEVQGLPRTPELVSVKLTTGYSLTQTQT